MAHFAKIDDNNIVKQVVVVSNDVATTEQAGMDFLNNLYNNIYSQYKEIKDKIIFKHE